MDDRRQNPDLLLRAVTQEIKEKGRGRLKIFFGYAAGVGKTYAMLKAAHLAKGRGVDVVCGYIEPHARPQTMAMVKGLESIPVKEIEYRGIHLKEFDLDAAIRRKPQLILVDEYAHTNGEGCRHIKRYQDIQELLEAGIDVYTTVNVQHIESLNDLVASITGVTVQERIPDTVFDDADQVELVDIEPGDLLERLNAGRVYGEDQAKRAMVNFFTLDHLTALREIALRRCADRVNRLAEIDRIKNKGDYHTGEHILVCLSSAPSNPKIIRTAARMANAFRSPLTALFVETPDYVNMSEENKKRLRSNTELAKSLGARIETVYGQDISEQIAEYAQLSNVSKIVIGRSAAGHKKLFGKPTLTEMVIQRAPNLDVHIIPDAVNAAAERRRWMGHKNAVPFSLRDLMICIGLLAAATVTGIFIQEIGQREANVIAVSILAVLLSAVFTSHYLYSVMTAVGGVLLFNFFFTEPRYTFAVDDPQYLVTFVIMFTVAMISSSLAVQLKSNAQQSARAAYRTRVLFETNQLLQQSNTGGEILDITASQLVKLLGRDLLIYMADGGELRWPRCYPVGTNPISPECFADNERAAAEWTFRNNRRSGATTDTLSSAKCLYLTIRTSTTVYGVIGIRLDQEELDGYEKSILLSIMGECALALESVKNAKEKEEAAILAKNEQLRANLLRGISHDLRTPLTSISGNASNLMANWKRFPEETVRQLHTDIYDESMWLINLVENLLSVTRLEEGQLGLHPATELLDDIIAEAMKHLNRQASEHSITVELEDDLLLVQADARLVVQVFVNLLDNAVKYTQPGSEIRVKAEKRDKMVQITVADNGPGIPKEDRERVFEMFYCGSNRLIDSRRSIGIGLSLCRSIVTAHGGTITAAEHQPRGTEFIFTLPAGEVTLRE